MLALCSSLIDNWYPCLPAGPLRTSCLCSCHSLCFECTSHFLPGNVGIGLNDRLSPVSANETGEMIRSGVVKIAAPQQNTWHFSNQYQLSVSASLLASRHNVIHKSFSLMDFHNIYAMQLYVICTKRGSGDVPNTLKRFQGVLQLIVCP